LFTSINFLIHVPVDDEVGPEVDHLPGEVPVLLAEVEDPGGEEVQQLIAVGHAPGDGGLLA